MKPHIGKMATGQLLWHLTKCQDLRFNVFSTLLYAREAILYCPDIRIKQISYYEGSMVCILTGPRPGTAVCCCVHSF